MGFSTPSWIAQLPQGTAGGITDAAQKGALVGYDLGQKRAVRGALNGLDINDPASINQTIGALARAGASDAAGGILSLNGARAIQQVKLPLYQAVGKQVLAGMSGQSSAQAPDVSTLSPDAHDHILGSLDAMDGIEKQLSAVPYGTDGAARRALLSQLAPSLHERGIDPAVVANFDPTDANIAKTLQDHATTRAQIAALYPQPAQDQTPGTGPTSDYGIADANMRNPLYSNPASVGILKEMGIDPSDTLNRDVTITSPMRTQEAAVANARALKTQEALAPAPAPFGAVNTPNPSAPGGVQVQPAQGGLQTIQNLANADATGKNTAPPALPAGSQYAPAPGGGLQVQTMPGAPAALAQTAGAISGAQSGASAAATAPYELVPGMTDPTTGAPLYRTKADVAARNIPSQGASPSTTQAQGVSGQENAKQALALQSRAADVPSRKAALENLRQLAPQFAAGPHAGFWKGVGAIAAQYGIPTPSAKLSANATSAQEEFDKLSVGVLAAQRAAMGLPVTDASSAMVAGATPNERLTPKGIQRVTGVMEGNEDYLAAQNQAWQTWSKAGHGGETFGDFQSQFNRLIDPRVFQAQYMTPDEKSAVRASVGPKIFDKEEAAAERLGWIGRAQ